MESDSDSTKKPADKKAPPPGNNFVWYLLGLGVLLLMAVTLFGNRAQQEIGTSDFKRLVEASSTKADRQGPSQIDVIDSTTTPPRTLRFSNPRELVLDTTSVSGKVDRQIINTEAPNSPTTQKKVAESQSEAVRFITSFKPTSSSAWRLLDKHGLPYKSTGDPNWLVQMLPSLLMLLVLMGLIGLMLRRVGGAGSPMAFGRSRGKLYAQEDLDVTFDDVAGIDEAVEELREVVDFLKNPERYQRLGGRIPKGVLLVGPPGTGKTLLGKAVAGEAGVPFFSLSGSDFVEMFVGVGAARVRDMFQQAAQRAPCIIFIDELDALGKTRGSGNLGSHDEREQTLNALLVEMDGFGTNSGVIVMGATNRPETLDPALLRPGRFDRHVLVDRPDVGGREEIIEVHLQNIKVGSDVDVRALASITSGFVGADLANMVNEAALLAARNGKELVGMEEFNEAVERASIGLEKKSRIMLDEEKLRLAYHEGGHALVAYSLPNTDPVHKVSIIPRGLSALGYMQQRPEHDRYMVTRSQLESRIQVMLAGTLAEELIYDDVGTGASNDLERATDTARSMVMDYGMSRLGRVTYRDGARSAFLAGAEGPSIQHHSEQTAREIDQEVKRIIDEGLERCRHILEARRPALEAIAKSLLKLEVIDATQLKKIIDENSPSPLIVPGTDTERKAAVVKLADAKGDSAEA